MALTSDTNASFGVAGVDDTPSATSDDPAAAQVEPDRSMQIELAVEVGALVDASSGNVVAKGLQSGSEVVIVVRSSPVEVARLRVGTNGTAVGSFDLPGSLADGLHHIISTGVRSDGVSIGQEYAFSVSKNRISRGLTARPEYAIAGAAVPDRLAFYSPADDAPTVLAIQSQVFAAVVASAAAAAALRRGGGTRTVRTAGGSAGAKLPGRTGRSPERGRASAPTTESEEGGEYSEVYAADAVFAGVGEVEMTAIGDRSRSWRWPGTSRLDQWSRDAPDGVNRVSPLLARSLADGEWLRAALGTMALLVPLAGALLGVLAANNAGGTYLPPSTAWLVALLVIGIADAGAGVAACVTYLATTLMLGGLPSGNEARATVGLLTLWFAPILGAAMMRPVRRVWDGTRATAIDRVGDCVFGPMFGAWTAQNAVLAQSGLTGRALPLADQAGRITALAFGLLVLRYLVESAVLQLYPQRCVATDCGEPDMPSKLQQVGSVVLRATLFGWIAMAFLPFSWQVVFGAATLAFSILAYLEWIGERLPNVGFLHRFVPGELTMMLAILVGCEIVTRGIPTWEPDPNRQVLMGLFYYGLPTIALGLLALLGREGKRPEWKTWHAALGVPMAALFAKFLFGLW